MIDTAPLVTGDAPTRQTITLTGSEEQLDPLFLTNGAPTPVRQIDWRNSDALRTHHDLTRTILAGNLIPATQGRRRTENFTIGGGPAPPAAIECQFPLNRELAHRVRLRRSCKQRNY